MKPDLTTIEGVKAWANDSVGGYDLEYYDIDAEAAQIARAMRIAKAWDNSRKSGRQPTALDVVLAMAEKEPSYE